LCADVVFSEEWEIRTVELEGSRKEREKGLDHNEKKDIRRLRGKRIEAGDLWGSLNTICSHAAIVSRPVITPDVASAKDRECVLFFDPPVVSKGTWAET
jgi:hypothetical protein